DDGTDRAQMTMAIRTATRRDTAIDSVSVSAFTVPTEQPEADGTFQWDSTTWDTADDVEADGARGPAKVVVITGATSGVGRATAVAFAERGWSVALLARGADGLEAAAKDVDAHGGTPLPLASDVSSADEVERAAAQAEARLGPIDVWVNDAMTSVF